MKATQEYNPTLGIKRGKWRGSHDALEQDAAFREAKKRIWHRDRHQCQGCGFRADQYLEVHHINGDHGNHNLKNLVLLCPLCHQVHHLGFAGMAGRGSLIHAPDIPVFALHVLIHSIWALDAMAAAGHREKAVVRGRAQLRELHERLSLRQASVIATLGPEGGTPTALSSVMESLSTEEYKRRGAWMGGLRLLPELESFPVARKAWGADKGPYRRFPPDTWSALVRQYLPRSLHPARSPA